MTHEREVEALRQYNDALQALLEDQIALARRLRYWAWFWAGMWAMHALAALWP